MLPYYQTVGSVLHDIIVGWCYYITFLWFRLNKVEQDMKTTIDQVNNCCVREEGVGLGLVLQVGW